MPSQSVASLCHNKWMWSATSKFKTCVRMLNYPNNGMKLKVFYINTAYTAYKKLIALRRNNVRMRAIRNVGGIFRILENSLIMNKRKKKKNFKTTTKKKCDFSFSEMSNTFDRDKKYFIFNNLLLRYVCCSSYVKNGKNPTFYFFRHLNSHFLHEDFCDFMFIKKRISEKYQKISLMFDLSWARMLMLLMKTWKL